MKKKFLALILAIMTLAGAVSMTGCSSNEPVNNGGNNGTSNGGQTDGDKILLGFSLFDNTQPFAVAYSKSVFAEAEARGYDYVYTDAQNDTSKQVSDVEDLISQGIDYLILFPIEYESAAACLDVAKDANVPVFLWARTARGEAGVDYVTAVTGDFLWEGQAAGEWLVENAEAGTRIVELEGTTGSDCAIKRKEGFDSVVTAAGMEIVASQDANFVRTDGQKVMENLIQSLGADGFDVVYAHSDEMALGAVMALRAAGIEPGKDVMVISIDGELEAMNLIKEGAINCIVTCTPNYSGLPFDVLEKALAGEEMEPWYANSGMVVDATNVEEGMKQGF